VGKIEKKRPGLRGFGPPSKRNSKLEGGAKKVWAGYLHLGGGKELGEREAKGQKAAPKGELIQSGDFLWTQKGGRRTTSSPRPVMERQRLQIRQAHLVARK